MKILSLETRNVRGLPDQRYAFGQAGVALDLVVVTGAPGSGKTSMLHALAANKERLAAYGAVPSARDVVRPGSGAPAKMLAEWLLDEDELKFTGMREPTTRSEVMFQQQGITMPDADPGLLALLERYSHAGDVGKVDLFPSPRSIPTHAAMVAEPVFDQKLQRLAWTPAKYAGLARFARDALTGIANADRAEPLRALFEKLCPWRRIAGVDGMGVVEFHDARGTATSLFQLSFSEMQAFLFAGTMVMLGHARSIILLDTPELGLAPGHAARMLRELRGHAPGNQWIVASTDPDVIAMVDRDAVIQLGGAA